MRKRQGKTKAEKLKVLQDFARERGGKCLSKVYTKSKDKHKWKCIKGHIFEQDPDHTINRNHWCPYCSKNKQATISDLKKFAKKKGGKCLSATYINNSTKYEWECAKGHKWWASSTNVTVGGKTWCPECGGSKKKSINDLHEIAKRYEGKCLSTEYINTTFKYKWICKFGHKFNRSLTYIQSKKSFCPKC